MTKIFPIVSNSEGRETRKSDVSKYAQKKNNREKMEQLQTQWASCRYSSHEKVTNVSHSFLWQKPLITKMRKQLQYVFYYEARHDQARIRTLDLISQKILKRKYLVISSNIR